MMQTPGAQEGGASELAPRCGKPSPAGCRRLGAPLSHRTCSAAALPAGRPTPPPIPSPCSTAPAMATSPFSTSPSRARQQAML